MYPGILRKMEVSIRTRPDTILYDSETSKKSDLIGRVVSPKGVRDNMHDRVYLYTSMP